MSAARAPSPAVTPHVGFLVALAALTVACTGPERAWLPTSPDAPSHYAALAACEADASEAFAHTRGSLYELRTTDVGPAGPTFVTDNRDFWRVAEGELGFDPAGDRRRMVIACMARAGYEPARVGFP